jgi:AcrR family transcriptional regulator
VRITAEEKERTRRRILEVAGRLFHRGGYAETTTRDLASAAEIATGTLFNYFPSKEALGLALVSESEAAGRGRYAACRRGDETLEEDLFALVAAILRELAPHRGIVGDVVTGSLSPAVAGSGDLRAEHLEAVGGILARHGRAEAAETPVLHLYWTLFVGVLAWWSTDASPDQEDTLALLDRSMRLFAETVRPGLTLKETGDE